MDFSSQVTWARRRPRSLTKIIDCGPMTPDVSMATGVNVCEESRWAYLVFFLSSANAATAPLSYLFAGISYYFYLFSLYAYFQMYALYHIVHRCIHVYNNKMRVQIMCKCRNAVITCVYLCREAKG